MVTEWAAFNARLYVQTADKDIPPRSQKEADKKTNWSKVAEYADFLERMKFEVEQARQSPQHFGAFIGMSHVLGVPEDYMTFEEYRAEQQRIALERAKEARDNVVSILERAANSGASFEAL